MSSVSTDQLFSKARTYSTFLDRPVSDQTLEQIFDLMKWGPTSANTCPGRFVFVRPGADRDKLVACMAEGNAAKTKAAPVVVIMAHDLMFHQQMGKLFPSRDMGSAFAANAELAKEVATYNGTLQNGYFILAARSLGLACGPMAGFDKGKVDAAFFANSGWRSNLVMNLGYGDDAGLYPRNPRLDFAEACKILGSSKG